MSEHRTLSGRLFQSLGAKYEKALPPLVDFAILGTTKSPEFIQPKAKKWTTATKSHLSAAELIEELVIARTVRERDTL